MGATDGAMMVGTLVGTAVGGAVYVWCEYDNENGIEKLGHDGVGVGSVVGGNVRTGEGWLVGNGDGCCECRSE